MKKVWLITGAGRGLGAEFVKAALADGDYVYATDLNTKEANKNLGISDNLIIDVLDITKEEQAKAVVDKIVNEFGRIDILVNNAGYGQFGYFELVSEKLIRQQFEVNIFGTMKVTRTVLPVMRRQKSGIIITISSIAGFVGMEGSTPYVTSKFAIDGWAETLNNELKYFGIHSMIIEPGNFRTDFLDANHLKYGDIEIEDYAEVMKNFKKHITSDNHNQPGDPKKLADALIKLVNSKSPPLRFVAGSEAVELLEENVIERRNEELKKWGKLSKSLDYNK